MIPLLQVLYPYIVLFYVVDCFIWLKNQQVAFVSCFRGKFCVKNAGLRFIGLSPFSRVFFPMCLPFFFSKDGIYLWNRPEKKDSDLYDPLFFSRIRFDEIQNMECTGSVLTVSRSLPFDFHSPYAADNMMKNILILKKMPRTQRDQEIRRMYASSTDPESIAQITSEYPHVFYALEILGMYLFANLFIVLPLFLYMNIPVRAALLGVTLLLAYLSILTLSTWYFQKCFRLGGMTFTFFMTLLFSPVTSVHAVHNITKHLLSVFDFIAVSAVLLDRDTHIRILKKELIKLHYSKKICPDNKFLSCLNMRESWVCNMLSLAGIAEDEPFQQPQKQDPEAVFYCPLCETEFVKGGTVCPDCNIELIAYKL